MSAASGVSEQKKASSGDQPRFQWDDPLLLDDALTEDERMVRDTARAYCQDKLMPRVLEANRHERFDREIMNELGALGLLGPTLPTDYAAPGSTMSVTAWSRARSSGSIPATARRCRYSRRW